MVAIVLRREMCRNRIKQRREVPDEPDGMNFPPFFFVEKKEANPWREFVNVAIVE